MAKRKTIHSIAHGKRWSKAIDIAVLEFPTGQSLDVNIANEQLLSVLMQNRTHQIEELALDEIVAFLYNAGQNWKLNDYVRRTVYENNLVKYLGYSKKAARIEADWIALFLSSSSRIFDLIRADLGTARILDDWIPKEEAMIKAFPRGKTLHIAPGNVPQSSVVSIIRAIITKNHSIVKYSSQDPFTAQAIVNSFVDIDPNHAVTTSISVVYWPSTSANGIGARIAELCDTIIAWGGQDAIQWAYKNAGPSTEVIAFGPKRSFAIVGKGCNLVDAARGVATDVTLYDQKACFSTRQAFVHSSVILEFTSALEHWLEKLDQLVARGVILEDQAGLENLTLMHAEFLNTLEAKSERNAWSIIHEGIDDISYHPLGRTIFVTPFDEYEEIYTHVDPSVQTIAVSPWEISAEIRNECSKRGASRIVECGLSNIFRVGGAHDGVYPLQRLVRIVSNEFPSKVRVKGINIPVNQVEFIEHDKLLDFIP